MILNVTCSLPIGTVIMCVFKTLLESSEKQEQLIG